MLWALKRNDSLEHPKHMVKLMGKQIKNVAYQDQGSQRNSKTQFHDFSMIFHDQQCNFHDYLMHNLQPSLLAASSQC